jgi:16S rRNA (guanine966-N2)-methyltransferase
VEVIRENLSTLGLEQRAEVFNGKTLTVLERVAADIIFLDPPYEKEIEYEAALTALGLAPNGLVISQHAARTSLKTEYGTLKRYRILRQGDNSLSFYQATV